MTTDPELRVTSDRLLDKLGELHNLEMEKRAAAPGTPRFIEISRDVEAAAREVLGFSARQTDIAVESVAHPESSRPPIETIDPPREVPEILADWREAERRLGAATAGTEAFESASADVERLRAEYRESFDAHRSAE